MRRGDSWVAVSVLAGILLAMRDSKSIAWGSNWVWPIPEIHLLGGLVYPPVISQEWRASGSPHYGVDLMYERAPGRRSFFVPDVDVPVLAANGGTLWSVERTPRGWAVVIDHGKPFATFYQHLREVDPVIAAGAQGVHHGKWGPPMVIASGQRLGVMGADPLDAAHVRHLHFAVWYQGAGDSASVDPSTEMSKWGRVAWTA